VQHIALQFLQIRFYFISIINEIQIYQDINPNFTKKILVSTLDKI